jgi:hypothetical protein
MDDRKHYQFTPKGTGRGRPCSRWKEQFWVEPCRHAWQSIKTNSWGWWWVSKCWNISFYGYWNHTTKFASLKFWHGDTNNTCWDR